MNKVLGYLLGAVVFVVVMGWACCSVPVAAGAKRFDAWLKHLADKSDRMIRGGE